MAVRQIKLLLGFAVVVALVKTPLSTKSGLDNPGMGVCRKEEAVSQVMD